MNLEISVAAPAAQTDDDAENSAEPESARRADDDCIVLNRVVPEFLFEKKEA